MKAAVSRHVLIGMSDSIVRAKAWPFEGVAFYIANPANLALYARDSPTTGESLRKAMPKA